MYARPTDRVHDRGEMTDLLASAPFMHLVSSGTDGLAATSIPMLVDDDQHLLVGHLAQANDHWRSLDGASVLVIAAPSDGYVSPAWYPSKEERGGRVVPTWNYESIHVHGTAEVRHDIEWLRNIVHRLTEVHESRRTDGGERWATTDAPTDFIDQQLRAIVGISVTMDRVEAKQKLSGNRSESDQAGVRDGLARTRDVSPRLLREMTAVTEPTEDR